MLIKGSSSQICHEAITALENLSDSMLKDLLLIHQEKLLKGMSSLQGELNQKVDFVRLPFAMAGALVSH